MRLILLSICSLALILTSSNLSYAQSNNHLLPNPGTVIIIPGNNGPVSNTPTTTTINPRYLMEDRSVLPPPNPKHPPKQYTPAIENAPIAAAPIPSTTGVCSRQREGYTKVDNLNLFYCDGVSWQVISLTPTAKTCTTNQLGKYSLTEEKRLEFCNGENWLETGDKVVENCASNQLGKMRFTTVTSGVVSTKVVQFCNGENWLDTTKHELSGNTPPPTGTCTPTSEYNPVCEEKGRLYWNASHATCLGGKVDYEASPSEIKKGMCGINMCNRGQEVFSGVHIFFCGSNGVQYTSLACQPFQVPVGVTVVYGLCPSH